MRKHTLTTLTLLASTLAFAATDEVRLFCLPVQHAGLRLGAMFMGSSPVHCALDVRQGESCYRTQASDVAVFVVAIPCDKRVNSESKEVLEKDEILPVKHYEEISGCDTKRLAEAARAYGDDSKAPSAGGIRNEENGFQFGYERPQGFGMPEYLPTTSNTYIRWILAECGAIVKQPKGARGWGDKPSFPGPVTRYIKR